MDGVPADETEDQQDGKGLDLVNVTGLQDVGHLRTSEALVMNLRVSRTSYILLRETKRLLRSLQP